MLTRSRSKKANPQGASIGQNNDVVSPPAPPPAPAPAPPASVTVARTPSKAKAASGNNRRQPSTPSSATSVRSASTPRKNEAFDELFRHGLAEDFESNGGLGVLKTQGGHWLERFLNSCIQQDKTKSSMAVYGPHHASDRRVKIRSLVGRWVGYQEAGTYQEKILVPLAVTPAEFRTRGQDSSSSDEEMDDSSSHSSDNSSYDSSIASDAAAATHRHSSTTVTTRREQANQLRSTRKAPKPPAVVSPPPYKATKTTTRLPIVPPPAAPPTSSTTSRADTMSTARQEEGALLMPTITYDPDSINPYHTFPFVVGEFVGLQGVGRYQGDFFNGFGLVGPINPHYFETNPGMKNLFEASVFSDTVLRVQGPFLDFILSHTPEEMKFKKSDDMDEDNKTDPMMEALFTLHAKYLELRAQNGDRDLPVVWHIQFPEEVKLSSKHIFAQDGRSEDSFEQLQLIPSGALEKSDKMNFSADRRYAYWRVANVAVQARKRAKQSQTTDEDGVADAFAGLAILASSSPGAGSLSDHSDSTLSTTEKPESNGLLLLPSPPSVNNTAIIPLPAAATAIVQASPSPCGPGDGISTKPPPYRATAETERLARFKSNEEGKQHGSVDVAEASRKVKKEQMNQARRGLYQLSGIKMPNEIIPRRLTGVEKKSTKKGKPSKQLEKVRQARKEIEEQERRKAASSIPENFVHSLAPGATFGAQNEEDDDLMQFFEYNDTT